MNVSRVDIVLRARRFWEAIDVGGLMFRRWLVPIVVFFGLPYCAVAGALASSIGHLPQWLPAVAIWWLNPLWDRLVMVPAGVLLFEPGASYAAMSRSLRRVFSLSLAADLTWRRFGPLRAYLIPVSMYERPKWGERAKRKRWLRKDTAWRLTGISALFLGLEALVALSLGLTISGLSTVSLVAYRTAGAGIDTAVLYTIIYMLVILCVEPLYALSCFSVYVNRRTTAEGWDLQLAFSRLRERFPAGTGKSLLVLLVVVFSLQAIGARAEQSQPVAANAGQSVFVTRARKVLSGNEFGRTITRRELTIRSSASSTRRRAGGSTLLNILTAEALRVVVLSIAVGLAILAIVMNRHRFHGLLRRMRRKREGPIETLPTGPREFREGDWIEESRREWRSGRLRESVGILYRGSLRLAGRRFGVSVSESATEYECLRVLKSANATPLFLSTFEDLTRIWIRLAWAGITPQALEFHRLCTALATLGEANVPQ